MPARDAFEYAVVRVVPQVEREEFVNAGIILFCRARDYLAARIELDATTLRAIAPNADVALIEQHLARIPAICIGGPLAGPLGEMPAHERWHWLVAPRSTILQVAPPHAGLCDEPEEAIDRLFDQLVRRPTQSP
jgi:hypothetical protein